MKILLCPDKFKGSITAHHVCQALTKGISEVLPEATIISSPMADGGDGSLDILTPLFGLSGRTIETVDPLGRPIKAIYYHTDTAAYVELASASGIVLLDRSEYNPRLTSTRGTGLMIRDAYLQGFKAIYLYIGGSATNDGGIGIASALGFEFLDAKGQVLNPIGDHLPYITKVHCQDDRWQDIDMTIMCDVSNPMYGPTGAAFTYAAQKGAGEEDILHLDNGLRSYAQVIQRQFGVDLHDQPGLGAAGAVSASLVALVGAELQNGFDMLAQATQLKKAIQEADLVITGEGKVDHTSYKGKVVGNVIDLCRTYGKPCGVVCGVSELAEVSDVVEFVHSIMSLANDEAKAMAYPDQYLYEIGRTIAKRLSL